MFNIEEVRTQFPALSQKINGNSLVYLDSAATTLKPQVLVERISHFYSLEAANVHRGAHHLSDAATNEFEAARDSIKNFINAETTEEIIFTRGTTDSINLVASSLAELLHEGDEIALTEMEHHSNIVAWQVLAQKKKCLLKYISVLENGDLDLNSIDQVICEKTKIVAFTACSNILGTLTPIEKIVEKAKAVGAFTLLDAAQYVSQKKIDVQSLKVDFLVFSSHKLFGPFGFGVLYGTKKLLNKMSPYQYGGSMISSVGFFETTFNHLPFKFEAGTPHVEGAIATKTAIDFFNQWPTEDIFNHEHRLLNYAEEELQKIEGLQIFGQSADKSAIISFNIQGIHHSDIGQILDQQGIAVRVGHHCTQPLLKKFGLTGTVRASISMYNNLGDIERLIEGVKKAKRMLS